MPTFKFGGVWIDPALIIAIRRVGNGKAVIVYGNTLRGYFVIQETALEEFEKLVAEHKEGKVVKPVN